VSNPITTNPITHKLPVAVVDGEFVLDRGQSAESALPAASVVGAFDPDDDREAELLAAGPALPVEHILLQQREERLHRSVVTGGRDEAHRPRQPVRGEHLAEGACRSCSFTGIAATKASGGSSSAPGTARFI